MVKEHSSSGSADRTPGARGCVEVHKGARLRSSFEEAPAGHPGPRGSTQPTVLCWILWRVLQAAWAGGPVFWVSLFICQGSPGAGLGQGLRGGVVVRTGAKPALREDSVKAPVPLQEFLTVNSVTCALGSSEGAKSIST